LPRRKDSKEKEREKAKNAMKKAPQEISRRKPILANRVPEGVENPICEVAIQQPAWGEVRRTFRAAGFHREQVKRSPSRSSCL
jgi:hypothetical protein